MDNVGNFILWEAASRDTIDFKRIYVDIVGDLIAGLLLSQIVFWNLPSKDGKKNKLTVYKKDKLWLAKQRSDWWDEIRITPRQYDRAIKKLKEKDLVEVWNTMYNGQRTPHIWLNIDRLTKLINVQIDKYSSVLHKRQDRSYPKVKTHNIEYNIDLKDLYVADPPKQ